VLRTPPYFRLGDWLVRPGENLLIRGASSTRIEPRVMDLLSTLALAAGEILSSEELLLRVWRGTFYGDNPVHKAIAQLRHALGDEPTAPKYLETVRKRGYRIVAPVHFPEGFVAVGGDGRSTWPGGSPFRGLESFAASHAPVFHGRTRGMARVLAAMKAQRDSGIAFVLCVGMSGVGKTSLLQAGVIPLLLRPMGFDGLNALAAASFSVTADRPLDGLARALSSLRIGDTRFFLPAETATLANMLAEQPDDVVGRIKARIATMAPGKTGSTGVVLLVDELEGLLHESTDESRLFLNALRTLARCGHVDVLAACRSDAYARLGSLPLLLELKEGSGHVDLAPPTPGELAEILREPAKLAGLAYERDPLSRQRLDDVLRDAAAHHPECLPLLQYTLEALYQARSADGLLTFAAYRELGGLEGALAKHAETVFLALPESTRNALHTVLARTVRIGADEKALLSQPVRWRALATQAEVELCEALVDARLFVSTSEGGERIVRPAHDALLREWRRAAEWVATNRAALAARTRLANTAARWDSLSRPVDLLLPPGLPLEEARAVLASSVSQSSPVVLAFVATSLARARRSQHIRNAVQYLVVALSLALAVAGIGAFRAERAAELQRDEARRLVGFMLDDLNRSLQPLGRLDVLDGVARAVQGYLERSASDGSTDQVHRFRGDTLTQLGQIHLAKGDDNAALRSFDAASGEIAAGLRRSPDDSGLLHAAGTTAYWIGYVHYRARRADQTALAWQAYHDYSQRWLVREPENTEALLEHSYAINNLAVLTRDRGDLALAAEHFATSAALKRQVLLKRPNDSMVLADLADTESWQGTVLADMGRMEQAQKSQEGALATTRALRESSPGEGLWRHREASVLMNLALVAFDRNHLEAADDALSQATVLLAALVELDPKNRDWQRDLLFSRQEHAWMGWFADRRETARTELASTLEALASLRAGSPHNAEWRRLEAVIATRLASIMIATGETTTALKYLDRAASLSQRGEAEPLGDLAVRADIALTRGDALAASGQQEAANEAWRHLREELARTAASTEDVRVLDPWIQVHERLAEATVVAALRTKLDGAGYRRPSYLNPPSMNQGTDNDHSIR
jgi:DNA-binding winged helix-turn-helix (wHTH) protein/tetratricopeptide (TPR) repeat protein